MLWSINKWFRKDLNHYKSLQRESFLRFQVSSFNQFSSKIGYLTWKYLLLFISDFIISVMRCKELKHWAHTSLQKKKWSFPLRISSVNVVKSADSWGVRHIYWRNPLWKTSFFVQCLFLVYKLSRENTHPENICDIAFEKAKARGGTVNRTSDYGEDGRKVL